MKHPEQQTGAVNWRCLACRGPLTSVGQGLRCSDCGKVFPVLAGIPILVREPVGYIRAELALLDRAVRAAQRRRDATDVRLPRAAQERHRDVFAAELARDEAFLVLLAPARAAVAASVGSERTSAGVARSGWTPDQLFPYLLRDWTNTEEFGAASAAICGAVERAFPDRSDKTVVCAGCGAGGLLAELRGFENVWGFDLSLPTLFAARHLIDGSTLDLSLPHAINPAGKITLHARPGARAQANVRVLAMDALDTAFADGALDCVITSFMLDLLPDPRKLAAEIHRILSVGGVWINYGPSGPLTAFWRFDQTECAAFFEACGLDVTESKSYRTTYLDLSRDCPAWSFQNHVCYLTSARKSDRTVQREKASAPTRDEMASLIPQHFPNATIIERRSLGADQKRALVLRREPIPGRAESTQIGSDAARILELVDGKRTVQDIANAIAQKDSRPAEETFRAFADFFSRELVTWR